MKLAIDGNGSLSTSENESASFIEVGRASRIRLKASCGPAVLFSVLQPLRVEVEMGRMHLDNLEN